MEANKFYSIAESTKGQVLYILSEWNAHSLSPAADSAICQFTIYTSNMLFNSDSVTSENINSSLCTPNFYYKLREYFRNIDKNIRYEFCVSDEEDEAILVVSLPLDIASNTYLRILEVRLHRIFKQNSHLDFMNRLKYYANFKETQQDQATERVSTLASIQNVVEETKLAVEKLRQEAGLQLAAKFMGVINDHKDKIADLSNSPQQPQPMTQVPVVSQEPVRKKGKSGKTQKK